MSRIIVKTLGWALLCAAAAITPLLVFVGLAWLIWRLARDSARAPGAGATIAR